MPDFVTIFLQMAAMIGILIMVAVFIAVFVFVLDMASGVYEEYKKIRAQEQEQDEQHL